MDYTLPAIGYHIYIYTYRYPHSRVFRGLFFAWFVASVSGFMGFLGLEGLRSLVGFMDFMGSAVWFLGLRGFRDAVVWPLKPLKVGPHEAICCLQFVLESRQNRSQASRHNPKP